MFHLMSPRRQRTLPPAVCSRHMMLRDVTSDTAPRHAHFMSILFAACAAECFLMMKA